MDSRQEQLASLLVVVGFSRHVEAIDAALDPLIAAYGPVLMTSPDFSFHQTKYYDSTMGTGLRKRIWVFDTLVDPLRLPDIKHHTIEIERQLAESGRYPEARPLNLDPGLLQLGKFILATTKDQVQRIYLRDGIFAEVTLRYQGGAYEIWPWTYADYREADVRAFLNNARSVLFERLMALR